MRQLNWAELAKVDKSGVLNLLARFPEQCRQGLGLAHRVDDGSLRGFSRLVVLGMGGSGIAGDLLARFADVETVVVHGYSLPPWVGPESLVIALSYSGDTEETLAAFAQAEGKTSRRLAVSSGGKLGQMCTKQGIPWIQIPRGLPPRAALGYLLFPLLGLMDRWGLLRGKLSLALEGLENLAAELAPHQEGNRAQGLARELQGKVPLVYGAEATAPVAFRWKTQINENAKQPAFWAELPELCHNEIVGWELTSPVLPQGAVIFLRTALDHPRNALRVETLKDLLRARSLPFWELWGEGQDLLGQALYLLYFGDWVSVYLALVNGVDPAPVRVIQELKRRMDEVPM